MNSKIDEVNNPCNFFCSWSGGKDSALAFYKAIESGGLPRFLLTMMIETGERSRCHGISREILEKQASLMNIPIRFRSTSWDSYTENFVEELKFFKLFQLQRGVFGAIDGEIHLQWIHRVCHAETLIAWLPLWQKDREAIFKDLIEAGFQIEIIAVKNEKLSRNYLGKSVNHQVLEEFKSLGVDLCGENGEYHTLITNGPIFKKPLEIMHGKQVLRDGYWFSDVALLN